ncbi:MAG TPA: bacteriohemerythrin [Rhodocyclaceae bacterium]|nr:bacteriohemerythrin [Rhodocyclaceae bacterium]
MSREEDFLEASKLVLELTLAGSSGADLDELLESLLRLLQRIPSFHFRSQGAILLRNPRRELVPVAFHGLPAFWEDDAIAQALVAAMPDLGEHPAVKLFACPLPDGSSEERAFLVLPMRNGKEVLGAVVLFMDADWQPSESNLAFMDNLALAVSGMVARCVVNETLKVREIELEQARTEAIRRLGTASEYRDNETGMHVMRMTNFAVVIAKALGLDEAQREMLYIAAPMHDVGKIGISDAILLKPGRLTEDEYAVMKTHTLIGERILQGNDSLIATAREIASTHHEHWDGNGYPLGLSGEAIPVLARICAIADVFDALTSARPYKEPWTVDEAVNWIHGESGRQFDPAVVAAFDQAMPEILRIRALYRDDIIDPSQVLDLPEAGSEEGRWVKWDDSLRIGIDAIDEHHRYLFELTNNLFDVVAQKRSSRDVAKVLKALDKYAQVHFRAEERMMEHYGYGRIDVQRSQHHRFEEKVDDFYRELHETPLTARFDVLTYLRKWLVDHIRHEDSALITLVRN